MTIANFFFPRVKTKMTGAIYTTDEFHRIFARERDRSYRNGRAFAMVVLQAKSRLRQKDSADIIDVAKKRIRNIDEMGWYDNHSIGLLLPETSYEGAVKLAHDIQTSLLPKQEMLFSVLTYPKQKIGANTDNQGGTDQKGKEVSGHGSYPFVNWTGKPMPVWKRTLDLFGALAAIILLLPLLVGIAIFIKCVSPGPVFFRQQRLGYLAQPFTCWKFRTMKPDANKNKHRQHVYDLIHNGKQLTKIDEEPDASLIPLGNIIRKLGIDELPQLINVVRGEMSLVGPRPCMDYEAVEFQNWQHKRFDIHPGLTGLWQVSGKNHTTFEEMMRLDIGYGQKRSPVMDMLIFLKTVPALIRQVTDKINLKEVDYESNS